MFSENATRECLRACIMQLPSLELLIIPTNKRSERPLPIILISPVNTISFEMIIRPIRRISFNCSPRATRFASCMSSYKAALSYLNRKTATTSPLQSESGHESIQSSIPCTQGQDERTGCNATSATGAMTSPEDGCSRVLRNDGILPQHYTASQFRRP
jgi:hypothetical protein